MESGLEENKTRGGETKSKPVTVNPNKKNISDLNQGTSSRNKKGITQTCLCNSSEVVSMRLHGCLEVESDKKGEIKAI